MSRKTFFTRSFRIATVSLGVTFLSQGTLLAQTPTPTTSSIAVQAEKVLASEEFLQGIRVDISELKRTSGGTLTLKFAVVNDTTQDHSFDLVPLVAHVGGISLLDLQNKKKYLVMTDSAGACVCVQWIRRSDAQTRNPCNVVGQVPGPAGTGDKDYGPDAQHAAI